VRSSAMAGPFALIDRALNRSAAAAKGGYGGGYPGGKPRKGRDLNDPKTLEYLRRMHPDFDEVMGSADVDYRTRCHTDASFASKFRIPPVVEPQHTFREHTNSVDSVCWGPDPGTFISASHDATLKVWDSKRGACVDTLKGHVAGVYHCAVSGNKQMLLSCGSGQEKNVLLWRWPEKKIASVLQGHSRSVIHAAFSNDSVSAVTSGQDGTVIVYDIARGAATFRRNVHLGSCNGSSFCQEDSNLLISAGANGSLHFLDLREQGAPKACLLPSAVANSVSMKATLSIQGAHDGYAVHAVEFVDRTTVFSGGADHKLKRWDLRQMSPFKPRCPGQYLGHTAPVRSLAVSADKRFVVTGCEDGSLRIWPKDPLSDIRSSLRGMKMQLKDLDTDMQDFGRPAAERQAFSRKCDETKEIIAAAKKNEEQLSREGYTSAFRTLNGHVAQVSGCAWQEDSQLKAVSIVSSSWDQTLKLFNISLDDLK